MIVYIFILLVAFQIKHFFADYPLQTKYMLGKFKPGWDFVLPLLAHVGVHGVFTFLIAWCFLLTHEVNGRYYLLVLGLPLFDMVIHFFMDRIKASPKYLGRFKPITKEQAPTATPEQWRSNSYFWHSLGFDQLIHHLTHYAVIFCLIYYGMK